MGYTGEHIEDVPDNFDIISRLDVFSDRMTKLEGTVNNLDSTIRGNGKQGLVTQVALLQLIVTEIEKRDKESGRRFISWSWLVEKAFMPVLLAIIVAVITAKLVGGV